VVVPHSDLAHSLVVSKQVGYLRFFLRSLQF
jgi:hypothetical protein